MKNSKMIIPPIKCQGIKTKIVPFIKEKVDYNEAGVWIEPFVGTGVVAFNIAPQKALLCDKNPYIIALYQEIQNGNITSQVVKEFLEFHGAKLEQQGSQYYKEMRDAFNENGNPLYFLFLNRSDFNGMIRFNRHGQFNVPFCQKPNRFAKAYVTKICNQVANVAEVKSTIITLIGSAFIQALDRIKHLANTILNPSAIFLILLRETFPRPAPTKARYVLSISTKSENFF